MAKDRLSLNATLLSTLGSTNVYFQPPPSLVLNYPCIIYKLDGVDKFNANDKRYLGSKRYLLTVVDKNPDSNIYDKILNLPYSNFETSFCKDSLNHYVCSLYW